MEATWTSADRSVQLFLGDAREIAPRHKYVDAVLTDPPYGIRHSSSKGASWQDTEIAGDDSTETRDAVLREFMHVPVAAFGTWKTEPIENTRGVLVWDKGPASGMGDLSFPWKPSWELIYVRGDGWSGHRGEAVLRGHTVLTWESKGRCHPHEKPVSLIEALMAKLPSATIFLDPFMGSGPTGEACVRAGKRFVGIECDPVHFETAKARIQEALGMEVKGKGGMTQRRMPFQDVNG